MLKNPICILRDITHRINANDKMILLRGIQNTLKGILHTSYHCTDISPITLIL